MFTDEQKSKQNALEAVTFHFKTFVFFFLSSCVKRREICIKRPWWWRKDLLFKDSIFLLQAIVNQDEEEALSRKG